MNYKEALHDIDVDGCGQGDIGRYWRDFPDTRKFDSAEYRLGYPEIFKLHEKLKEANIQHDFIERRDPRYGRWFQILYPSKEDWNLMNGEEPREGCCSVIQDEKYGSLEIMGLVRVPLENMTGYPFATVSGCTADEVFERIKMEDVGRMTKFKHFSTL